MFSISGRKNWCLISHICMYMYVYVYICIYMYTYTHIFIRTYTYTYSGWREALHDRIWSIKTASSHSCVTCCLYVYTYIFIYIYICIYTYTYLQIFMYIYVKTNINLTQCRERQFVTQLWERAVLIDQILSWSAFLHPEHV